MRTELCSPQNENFVDHQAKLLIKRTKMELLNKKYNKLGSFIFVKWIKAKASYLL